MSESAKKIGEAEISDKFAASLAQARMDLIMMHTPQALWAQGMKISGPLDHAEALEMYRRMNSLFYSWTGQTLRRFDPDAAISPSERKAD